MVFRSNPSGSQRFGAERLDQECEFSSCQKWRFRFSHPIIKLYRWPLKNQPVQGSPCTSLTCTAASLWEKTLCSESNCPGKKTTQTSGTDQFLPGRVFTWIFKLSKNRQELFYYSTTELGSIWETQLFFSKYHITLFRDLCLWVCARICASVSLGDG